MAGPNNGQVFSGSALDVATAVVEGNLTVGGTQTLSGNQTLTGNQSISGTLAVTGATTLNSDLILATAPRIKTTGTVPTVGSGGSGTSALSIIAGSTNVAGLFQVTLTAVAPGVVAGVVAFGGAPLATAPLVVVCALSAPTAGVAAPPVVGADSYTTSGFTVRVYGPTTVTTATYIVNWIAFF